MDRIELNTNPPLELNGLSIPRYQFDETMPLVWTTSLKCPVRVFWVNAHALCISEKNSLFKEALKHAEFLFNDGVGIELAGIIFQKPVKANLNGTDWIPKFCSFLSTQKSVSVFLLGAEQRIIEQSVKVFKERWPYLTIAGYHQGYFENDDLILTCIEKARPDILLIGMGVPLQELFITKHWQKLQSSGVRIAIGGGAVFDFLTKKFPRAPLYLRRLRLEWAFRLFCEPKRLWNRYLKEGSEFLFILFNEWLKIRRNDKVKK